MPTFKPFKWSWKCETCGRTGQSHKNNRNACGACGEGKYNPKYLLTVTLNVSNPVKPKVVPCAEHSLKGCGLCRETVATTSWLEDIPNAPHDSADPATVRVDEQRRLIVNALGLR